MRDLLGSVNGPLEREAPELFQALSPLGRRAVLTTPGAHGPAPALESLEAANLRPALRRALGGLQEADRALAFSPSPITGLPEVRERWRVWQRRGVDPGVPSTLPLVTAGLSHGLSLLADLFGGEGKAVAVPEPFWGNYRQAFAARTGARILTAPAYVDGRFHTRALAVALNGLPDDEPAVAMLNLPSNPGGYSPTDQERREIRASLIEVAERRPLVVVCDDAYAGLVFEPGVDPSSMFWELIGVHPNLVPVKVDGSTKELSFFGGRVGFLTFGLDPESDAARALEDKVAMLVRSTIGSPVASSQMIVLQALRQERAALEAETEAVRLLLEGRYRALKGALAEADPEVMTTLPFNSGCFALVELPEALGVTSSAARRHLLDRHDTGLVSIEPRYLRIAHCSVDAAALPELARRLERGIGELAGATAGSS
jgi:aspartate/methionine/tyrosine aminotransferase